MWKKRYFVLILIMFLLPLTSYADLLWPMQVGQKFIYQRTDGSNPPNSWSMSLKVIEKVTMCSEDYYLCQRWNYGNNDGTVEMYFRSTENAVYMCDEGVECIIMQIGPVGTTWTCGDSVTEIIQPENITVPYGGPYVVTVNKKHNNESPPGCYWYEYISQGLGLVKEVDYWNDNPPKTQELVAIEYLEKVNFIPYLLLLD